METIDAIKIIMAYINFDTNEFYMPEDFFDRAKLQSAVNHIHGNAVRTKLFNDALNEKKLQLGGNNETTREG